MKKLFIISLLVFIAFNAFSRGLVDDSPLTDSVMHGLELQIRKNGNVKDVIVKRSASSAKFCNVEVYLNNGGYLFFENHYSLYEYIAILDDYLIIDWQPHFIEIENNQEIWNLSLSYLVVSQLNLILNSNKQWTLIDVINNYDLIKEVIMHLSDCPIDFLEERFYVANEKIALPEKWYKYSSMNSFEIKGIPHKLFKLKISDFDMFTELQNFENWKLKAMSTWRND